MFSLTEDEAASIRTAYERGGGPEAADELRRLFPEFAARADAQAFAVGLAGWRPSAEQASEPIRDMCRRSG